MFRGRAFPQGRSQAGLAAGGRGGRTIGAPACWTCGSTAHFSAHCPRNLQTRGGGRGARNSGFRGGPLIASGKSGVRDVPSPQNPPTATEQQRNGFSTGTR